MSNFCRNSIILVSIFLLPLVSWAQLAGTLDRSFNYGRGKNYKFNYGLGTNGMVSKTVVQPDGKLLIAGGFNNYNGEKSNGVARLNIDGSLDPTFNPNNVLVNGSVFTIALQTDGKIIIGGDFTTSGDNQKKYLARLNTDGSIDNTFNTGTGPNGWVWDIALQYNSKIIISGNFTTYYNKDLKTIARLNTDGSLDTTFNFKIENNDSIIGVRNRSIIIQEDDKILISGYFELSNDSTKNYLMRLNPEGDIDETFHPEIVDSSSVLTMALQNDKKLIIGGVNSFDGIETAFLYRLNYDGNLDKTFNANVSSLLKAMGTIAIQPDGKIIIGGEFQSFNFHVTGGLLRLISNGSLDSSFNLGNEYYETVRSIALKVNGKIIIGGEFLVNKSNNYRHLTQLNADGSLDTTFNLRTGADNTVRTIVLQPDKKIIIGGTFTTFNGISRNNLARLNPNGGIDETFYLDSGANGIVTAIALQPNGKIIIAGNFTRYNRTMAKRIVRLNKNGTLDKSFNARIGANDIVTSVVLQPNGKIIIAGSFNSFNSKPRFGIARLNTDGNLDETFNSDTIKYNGVKSIALQKDGKIIIGGGFNNSNKTERKNIARLNTDGSVDTSFHPEIGAYNHVQTIVIQSDDKIVVGGRCPSYFSSSKNNLIRLNPNGSPDPTFGHEIRFEGNWYTNGVHDIGIQPDGKLIVVGKFYSINGYPRNNIARLNNDGTMDTTFIHGTGTDSPIQTLVLQSDNKIIIGGEFIGYSNLSTPFIARILGDENGNFKRRNKHYKLQKSQQSIR